MCRCLLCNSPHEPLVAAPHRSRWPWSGHFCRAPWRRPCTTATLRVTRRASSACTPRPQSVHMKPRHRSCPTRPPQEADIDDVQPGRLAGADCEVRLGLRISCPPAPQARQRPSGERPPASTDTPRRDTTTSSSPVRTSCACRGRSDQLWPDAAPSDQVVTN